MMKTKNKKQHVCAVCCALCAESEHGNEIHGKKETKCVYNIVAFAITAAIAPQLLLLLLSSSLSTTTTTSLSSCCCFARVYICVPYTNIIAASASLSVSLYRRCGNGLYVPHYSVTSFHHIIVHINFTD